VKERAKTEVKGMMGGSQLPLRHPADIADAPCTMRLKQCIAAESRIRVPPRGLLACIADLRYR
jgi:hypothetical protein